MHLKEVSLKESPFVQLKFSCTSCSSAPNDVSKMLDERIGREEQGYFENSSLL